MKTYFLVQENTTFENSKLVDRFKILAHAINKNRILKKAKDFKIKNNDPTKQLNIYSSENLTFNFKTSKFLTI